MLLSDAQWAAVADLLPGPTGREGDRSRTLGRWSRASCTGIERDRVAGPAVGVRAVADGVEVASPPRRRWTLGHGPRPTVGRRGCGRAGRLVCVGRLDDRPCASARDEHRPDHRGLRRITRIRASSRLTTASAAHSGALSTKVHQFVDGNGLPLLTMITPGQPGTRPCSCHCSPTSACAEASAAPGPGRTGPGRQGVLLPRDPAALALAWHRVRDPGTPRPAGPPAPAWLPWRTPRNLRPGRLQEPQRHRTRLLPV